MKMPPFAAIFASSIFIFNFLTYVSAHGRLVEPPSRSSMWRFGFATKPNYNDNELFCGGYTVQWQRNGGKCGICGDAWHLPTPRPNEAGGMYGRGIIVRKYKPGQVIKATVDITANHKGFFEFKLCPHNSPSTEATQDCLDQYPLEVADGSGTKYYPSAGTGPFSLELRLPSHLTCSQCVFQWSYTAGNNWGRCEDGKSKVGCGPQETFRGCADVAIDSAGENDIPGYNEKPSISAIPVRKTTRRPRPTRPTKYWTSPKRPYSQRPTRRPIPSRKPVPTRRITTRPAVYRPPSPLYPSRGPQYVRPSNPTRRPQTVNRPSNPSYPSRKPQTAYRPTSRRYTTRRPTITTRKSTYKRIYTSRPIPYNPFYTKRPVTKKPRPTYKTKAQTKKSSLETEKGGSCRAVGVWQSISGIASWCDSNCARGYCPASHCDCS